MATYDLASLVALEPPGAGRIHLHLPGYRPGKKVRSQANAPLCGVFVYADARQVGLDVARLWTHVRPIWAGSEMAGERYWCPPCLGRLVELMNLQDSLVGDAMAKIKLAQANESDSSLTPPVNVGNLPGVRASGTENGTPARDTGT
jgi:hypothetical protein